MQAVSFESDYEGDQGAIEADSLHGANPGE